MRIFVVSVILNKSYADRRHRRLLLHFTGKGNFVVTMIPTATMMGVGFLTACHIRFGTGFG